MRATSRPEPYHQWPRGRENPWGPPGSSFLAPVTVTAANGWTVSPWLPAATGSEALDVMAWISESNASDAVIGELARTAAYLAGAHAPVPAARMLPEGLGGHRAGHWVLGGGRQRLSQARELRRTDFCVLPRSCRLL